jgi:3-hydroxybutyryl-CoA dehydrogenase
MTDLNTVGVAGMGTMGAGIAQVIAASGREVLVLEAGEAQWQAGMAIVRRSLAGGVSRGKLTESAAAQVTARIHPADGVVGLAQCDLVIEAIVEQREAKWALLTEIGEMAAADTLIVTNTSALSVSDLAAAVPNPERFGGLHFFNPAPLMRTVEVIRALQSGPDLVDRLTGFATSIGKEPAVVKDRPGFLVNYLLMPYLNDVIAEYDCELATATDIDEAIRLGLGHRLGPLELLDLIGLDVHAHATGSAYAATLDPRFAPPPLLTRMVSAGYLGAKNGRGFRTGPGGDVR